MKNVTANAGFGNMDLSSDPHQVKLPNFTFAKNILFSTGTAGTGYTVKDIKGNELAFTIANENPQNVIWRLTDLDSGTYYSAGIFDARKNTIYDATNIFATFSELTDDIQSWLTYIGFTYTFTDYGTYVTFELNEIPFYPYVIEQLLGVSATITQEARDESVSTGQQIIGSCDVLGDVFIISTPYWEGSFDKSLLSMADLGGEIELTLSSAHGLYYATAYIVIHNTGLQELDGFWLVDTTTALNKLVLKGSDSGTITPGSVTGTATLNSLGYGQVGVLTGMQELLPVYTKVLGANDFNYTVDHQVKMVGRPFKEHVAIYPTDGKNPPRSMYFNKPYITDGGLSINGGQYDYGTVSKETILWQSSSAHIEITSVENDGGSLLSGQYRVTATFLTNEGTESEALPLTNEVPIYDASLSTPEKIMGDYKPVVTNKRIKGIVTNIEPSMFKYVVIRAVYYIGGTVSGVRVKQILLDNKTEVEFEYSGLEAGSESYDPSELNFGGAIYDTAKNIAIVDNKLFLNNLTAKAITDLSDFAKTFRHRIDRKTYTDVDLIYGSQPYQDPMNCYNFMTLMPNETYRHGLVGRNRITGQFINFGFFVDDILIDNDPTVNHGNTNPADQNRRDAGSWTTLDMTDDNGAVIASEVYVPYISFSCPDLTFKIDGIPANELLSEIYIVRQECVPEILAMGLIYKGITGDIVPSGTASTYSPAAVDQTSISTVVGTQIYITPRGDLDLATIISDGGTLAPTYFGFYSPDTLMAQPLISGSGYKLINIQNGNQGDVIVSDTIGSPPGNDNHYIHMNGNMDGVDTFNMLDNIAIDVLKFCYTGDSTYINSNTFTNRIKFSTSAIDDHSNMYGCYIGYCPDVISDGTSFTDYTVTYGQIYKDLGYGAKYGDKTLGRYFHTGAYFAMDNTVLNYGDLEVFGGDVSLSYTRLKRKTQDHVNSFHDNGDNNLVGFWSFSRVNATMRGGYNGKLLFPQTATMQDWANSNQPESFEYNASYTNANSNAIDYKPAFDPNIEQITIAPTTSIWSNTFQNGSLVDDARVFLPMNFHVDDLKNGETTHIAEVNGELMAFQLRAFLRQYVNSNNVLMTRDPAEVILGSGQVMRANPQVYSTLGASHGFSVIEGTTKGGKKSVYWFNTEYKCIMRFGADGTVVISDRDNLMNWIADNLDGVHGWDIPAYGLGIHGIWDAQNSLAIWVVRGLKKQNGALVELFSRENGDSAYTVGTYVFWRGYAYVAVNPTTVVPDSPMGSTDWTKIPYTNTDVYTNLSIVYDENSNGFKCFNSPEPRIFLKAGNSYLSPTYYSLSVYSTCDVYTHNQGDYLSWYDGALVEEGFITFVDNKDQDEIKKYTNIQIQSLVVPYKVTVSNDTQTATMLAADFTGNKGLWRCPIKTADPMIGTYLNIKIFFEPLVEQRILNVLTKKTILNTSVKQV